MDLQEMVRRQIHYYQIYMVKILDGSIRNTITILRQWYLMLTGQECSGKSSLHLEDFRDHLFGFLI